MQKKYRRKAFLKLALLGPVGLMLKPLDLFSNNGNEAPLQSDNVTYFRKGSAEYELLRKGFNKRIDKYPQVIALCRNTAGVAEAIKYAAINNLPVTVKSGGHCMEGFSCIDNGMVVNLSLLNTVEFNNDGQVTVGPGCTLSRLYDTLLPKGRLIPGGSCGGVGIGGLVLGGGYGLLGRKFGLTCDSLQEVTMVDGNGVIRNSKDDKELLWACRGGGNGNFGVITSLKFKTHKAPAKLESFRFKTHNVDAAKARTILQKWFEAAQPLPPSCFSAFVLNRKTLYILLTNADKHDAEVQKFVDALSAVSEKTTHTKPQSLATALKVFYGRPLPLYFKNASAGLYKSFGEIEKYIDQVLGTVIATPGMIYQVNTLGGNIQNPVIENESAFPHRAFPFFSELQAYWDTEAQAPRLLKKFQEVQEVFSTNGITAQYRNYPDINFQKWDSLYYGGNYARLQLVKNRYDPRNLFRYEQSIRNA